MNTKWENWEATLGQVTVEYEAKNGVLVENLIFRNYRSPYDVLAKLYRCMKRIENGEILM